MPFIRRNFPQNYYFLRLQGLIALQNYHKGIALRRKISFTMTEQNLLFCLKFFTICLIFFVTKFVTRITKFVTCITKFVTHVRKFVIKNLLYDSKNNQAERENFLADGKMFELDNNCLKGTKRPSREADKKIGCASRCAPDLS